MRRADVICHAAGSIEARDVAQGKSTPRRCPQISGLPTCSDNVKSLVNHEVWKPINSEIAKRKFDHIRNDAFRQRMPVNRKIVKSQKRETEGVENAKQPVMIEISIFTYLSDDRPGKHKQFARMLISDLVEK